jgi:hypothetical protein
MEAKDLRIGNYLRWAGADYQVSSLHGDNTLRFYSGEKTIGCFPVNKFKPIPLTEEWLIKFGFEKVNKSTYRKGVITAQSIYITEGESLEDKIMNQKKGFRICFSGKFLCNKLYVHSLQNMYHANWNIELTIKEY